MKRHFDDDEKLNGFIFEPLSAEVLLKRGYCCGNGCKNCPYEYKNVPSPLRERLLNERKKAANQEGSSDSR